MTITALPTPPTRSDPANFAARGDALLAALPTFVTEANALAADVSARQDDVATKTTTTTTKAAEALASQTAAGDSETAAEAAKVVALAQAAAALANATQVATVNALATTKAAEAAASATTAATAKDQAIAAWASATAPAETLAAMSQVGHIGTVVKSIIYDTSKDSDGGAWTLKCHDKSWYQEALGGDRWIGQHATIAAAWTAAGSTTGAVFQASATAGPITVGKYYAATSASTATEVVRGVSREFPALALIVAESARVVIYDAAAPGCPMWMVFKTGGAIRSTESFSCVAAAQGQIYVGANYYAGDLAAISFTKDTSVMYGGGFFYSSAQTLVSRNATWTWATAASPVIVNRTVNDIAATVLPTAPIDPATGLAVPTVYAFTAGGVSRIAHDGTVSSTATNVSITYGAIDGNRVVAANLGGNHAIYPVDTALPTGGAGELGAYWGWVFSGSWSSARIARPLQCGMAAKNAVAGTAGLMPYRVNHANRGASMVAAITNAYNSGWHVGDSRFCGLADTVAETITAPELVVNGTFDTDISGWADASTAPGNIAWSAGAMVLTRVSGNNARADQQIATVAGVTYKLSADISGQPANYLVSLSQGGGSTLATGMLAVGAGSSATFVATGSAAWIRLFTTVDGSNTADNVSCKRVDPDRSVKNNGLSIVGSLTKTAVAAGAQLVCYGGFAPSNYLEQAYSSNLDFGTGDFCVRGWIKSGTLSKRPIYHRGQQAGTGYGYNTIQLSTGTTGVPSLLVSNDAGASAVVVATSAYVVEQWMFICGVRRAGVLEIYVNGALEGTLANTYSLTNVSAVARFGANWWNGVTGDGCDRLALAHVYATAPSAEQIAHIYRTELAMFQPGAQVTIAGTSTAVTAMAADDATDLLHVCTSWGRTSFKDLVRVESEATQVGSITSIDASGGVIVTGGTNLRVYQPSISLRKELRRKFEARKALGKEPVFFDFDAVTSQVAFVLQAGYTVKAVYSAGLLKRVGSTKDYTVATDGWKETVTFAVAPGNAVQVTLMAVRA